MPNGAQPQQKPDATQLSGLLLVDKSAGWTSHDAVQVVRNRLGVRRIGHAGTLDPAATGLLILLIGPAVLRQTQFQLAPKTYSGVISFGSATDTWDAAGKVVSEAPVPEIYKERLDAAIAAFTGEITQLVPPYSAIKFHGEPLHRIARRGGELPLRMERKVTIYGWEGLDWNPPELAFTVKCASGTYVRSLAHMLGQTFGCGAHLKTLRRLSIGPYKVEDAITSDSIRPLTRAALEPRILPLP